MVGVHRAAGAPWWTVSTPYSLLRIRAPKDCYSLRCRYPQGACELFSMPHNLPLDLQGKGPLFSSSSHGFLPKKYAGAPHAEPPCT